MRRSGADVDDLRRALGDNLLRTPEHGSRRRLRTVLTGGDLPKTAPSSCDPCTGRPEPCRAACPRGPFDDVAFTAEEHGQTGLPGRDGLYARRACGLQMDADDAASGGVEAEDGTGPVTLTRYCRACGPACIAGAD